MGFPPELADPFLRPEGFLELVESLPAIGLARQAHACTHTTFAPTVMRAGSKTNVIPDLVELEVDIRTLPTQDGAEIQTMLREALGDLADSVEVVLVSEDPSSASPWDTPLWDSFGRVAGALHPGASTVPFLTVGATDARFFRRLGIPSYGFGLFSERITLDDFSSMFHGDDERVDQESLRLSTHLWEGIARDALDNGD
jgi:acetylornithine deacetylase/succinyl-diaminopimelate desuccinylase-like protein